MLKGKMSIFGGPGDSGMKPDEGLSLYESHEADQRPDLFYPKSYNSNLGTSKRLKQDAFYFAYRFPLPVTDRKKLQSTHWLFKNPLNGIHCVCWLVDWGPAEYTGRVFDISPAAASFLGAETDQEIEAACASELSSLFPS